MELPPSLGDEEQELNRRLALVSKAFSPSSPITSKDLFSGRQSQLNRLYDVIQQRGQHALIYGERGVGKTSLSKVVLEWVLNEGCVSAYFTCSSADTYAGIWRKALDEVRFAVATHPVGFARDPEPVMHTASMMLPEEPAPDDVRRVLAALAPLGPVVIFIDEFDRPTDPETRVLFADTVKILSDHGLDATLVLVGVAGTAAEIIGAHESIGRSLVQIQMPLMTRDESALIVSNGMKAAELTVEEGFVEQVVQISQGLPHYTHLIAQHGARFTVERGLDRVVVEYLAPAVLLAMEDVSRTVQEDYHRATWSNRETIYEEVLLACALAEKDDIGQFGSADVREPLNKITNRIYDIPAYSSHLNDFSGDGQRGRILQKLGTQARFRYRFIDPLMPPFVIMRGLQRGLTKPSLPLT